MKPNRFSKYCNFCGKAENEVFKLIHGPANVHICDECVAAAQDVIVGEKIGRGAIAVIGRRS